MLSPRAQAFSVQNLLAASDEHDHKPTPPHLTLNTDWSGKKEAPWSNNVSRCDLNPTHIPPRPEEAACCDVGHTSSCRHPSIITTAGQTAQREGVSVELCQNDLWHAFHALGTEMIITRAGRRMFPAIRLHVTGLEPSALYRVSLEFAPCGPNKYRYIYHSSKWMVAGVVEREGGEGERLYLHPDSPLSGHTLTSQALSFDKVKLTNCTCPAEGQVSLSSMQKFQPKIHIDKVLEGSGSDTTSSLHMTFIFPQTAFMAVTAYQNHQITRLKIARNPFAKGFRHVVKHKNSLPLVSHCLPLSAYWPASPVHCPSLPGDLPTWKPLNIQAHNNTPFPGIAAITTTPPIVCDVSIPGLGCFHPLRQDWNNLPHPVSSLPLFQPPFPPSFFPFQNGEKSPLFLSRPQPINFASKADDMWQDVTPKREFKTENGAASSSGCDVAMSSPVVRSNGDALDLCQSR